MDGRYAELLAEDLGCKVSTARTAFIGEPQKRALGVVAGAFKHAPDSPEKRARMILLWAKRRGAGAFRQGEDRPELESLVAGKQPKEERNPNRALAEVLIRFWSEHPEELVAVLDRVEASINGRSS